MVIPESRLLADLTEAQQKAVLATEGAVLILAAAGSGKTRVITRRIAHLIDLGIPAWQILALTFTNKAAGEMRERVHTLVRDRPDAERLQRGLTVTTFHALCARLLRRYASVMEGAPGWGIRPDYSIYDSDDQVSLIKKCIAALDLTGSNWPPRSVLGAISTLKNDLKDAQAATAEAGDFHARTVARIFEAYEKGLRHANAVDFDDLLVCTVRLLRESEEARAEVQQRWRYLMIDEYQDTNHAQFVLSTLVVGREDDGRTNVCVVGDPDQSIYGWRGADISNILDFESQFPGATVIALGQNFRSSAPILQCADTLIRNNRRRKHKDLFTTREGGAKPMVVTCRDERHEAAVVLDWFNRQREATAQDDTEDEPLAWKDMAVFYRNNALSRVVEDHFRAAGIPYIIARGTAFYQRQEVKDLIAYLRVVANPRDDVSVERIVNKPARKIGQTSLEVARQWARAGDVPLFEAFRHAGSIGGLTGAGSGAMVRFAAMVDGWSGAGSFMGAELAGSLAELVGRVLADSGLETYYKGIQAKEPESDNDRVSNLQEVVSSAADFEAEYDPANDPSQDPQAEAAPPLLAMLRAFLERVSLVADADAIDPSIGAVTLMTLHAAKGLEFPAVAMIGLEEGLLPSMRAMESEAQLEEERRLAFVGITRSMRHLLITSARVRTQRGLQERTIASRFLGELPPDAIERIDMADEWDDHGGPSGGAGGRGSDRGSWTDFDFDQRSPTERRSSMASRGDAAPKGPAVGAAVRHPQFGIGEVVSVTGLGVNRRATIKFRDVGVKTLVLEYARLEYGG